METLFDGAMLDAAGQALLTVLQPERIMFLWLGVLVGLAIGLLPWSRFPVSPCCWA